MLKFILTATLTVSAFAQETWTRYIVAPYNLVIDGAKGGVSGWQLAKLQPNGTCVVNDLFDNRDTFWGGSDPEFWLRSVTKAKLSTSVTFHLSGDLDTFGRATNPTDVDIDMSSISQHCYRIRIQSNYFSSEMFVPWLGQTTGLEATLSDSESSNKVAFKLSKEKGYWILDLASPFPRNFAQAIFLIVESLNRFYSKHPNMF